MSSHDGDGVIRSVVVLLTLGLLGPGAVLVPKAADSLVTDDAPTQPVAAADTTPEGGL
ncbi:hypothetical protein ACH4UT_33985 [Streptomyces sp. NPDC020799]|uniref:hypothetical protein n=1 Tax=Streptomyces sp. NPDC020799 TaxID=3365091 RepID=UPI0037948CC0